MNKIECFYRKPSDKLLRLALLAYVTISCIFLFVGIWQILLGNLSEGAVALLFSLYTFLFRKYLDRHIQKVSRRRISITGTKIVSTDFNGTYICNVEQISKLRFFKNRKIHLVIGEEEGAVICLDTTLHNSGVVLTEILNQQPKLLDANASLVSKYINRAARRDRERDFLSKIAGAN